MTIPRSPTSGTSPPGSSPSQQLLMWRIAGMAFLMGSEAAAGALLGMLIDYWVGTPGRWLLIGGITGIVVGMTTFLRAAFKLNQQINADRSKTPPPHE